MVQRVTNDARLLIDHHDVVHLIMVANNTDAVAVDFVVDKIVEHEKCLLLIRLNLLTKIPLK